MLLCVLLSVPLWFKKIFFYHKGKQRFALRFIKEFRENADYLLTISLPNGDSAIAVSLKCCRPKGIPIIVMQRRKPNMA